MMAPMLSHREVSGVYFGGGTPNILKAEDYERLVDIAHTAVGGLPAGIEITLEGIPQLYTAAKLEAMKAAGINRISIGVQQIDDELVKLSGRRQSSAHVFKVLEIAETLGLRSSVDLIFGWPGQTVDHLERDLGKLIERGVEHLTVYELNLGGKRSKTHFATVLKDQVPGTAENLEMYRRAHAVLTAAGYRQESYCDWKKVHVDDQNQYQFEQNMRDLYVAGSPKSRGGWDMAGLGFAAVNHAKGYADVPGWSWMNHVDLEGYSEAIRAGRLPTFTGVRQTKEDLLVATLFQGVQNLKIDLRKYAHLFPMEALEAFEPEWKVLGERGWIEVRDGVVHVVGDGAYYVPIIQGLLGARRQAALKARTNRLRGRIRDVPWYLEVYKAKRRAEA
jgi:oxygen-independent coproporphyrinogen III oxidase